MDRQQLLERVTVLEAELGRLRAVLAGGVSTTQFVIDIIGYYR